jgi:hypothetical protein
MDLRKLLLGGVALGFALAGATSSAARDSSEPDASGLLFRLSADASLVGEQAAGQAGPTFVDRVSIQPAGGVSGGYLKAEDDQVLAWSAPGNIQAQRGALSFFWRARTPVGSNQFPLFRVSFANHSSWDMTFLRIDWNGEGFDAFVTDANLSRVRVSWTAPRRPTPDEWTHIAFTWDESTGVQLYVNGRLVARKDQPAVLDAGLDQFGPHSRIISPYQVQSRYNFMRGGDLDEIRIYDRALDADAVAALARNAEPAASPAIPAGDTAWARRLGFDGPPPPYVADAFTAIRRVEFTDQRDVAQRMWKGNDGIRETTWPGVYNRSRLEGRHDYFTLPDWNVYSTGGKAGTWYLPDEPWNQIEIQGAAYGRLTAIDASQAPAGAGLVTDEGALLARRAQGAERTTTRLDAERTGGAVRFLNDAQETPIQEIGAYRVAPGRAPTGVGRFDMIVRPEAATDFPSVQGVTDWIAGRYPAGERATVVATPNGAAFRPRTALTEAPASRPIVHILIPQDSRTQPSGQPLNRGATFGFENFGGLDGLELTIPALDLPAGPGGLVPLNIRIKDPLTPDRDLMDVNVSVKPGEARTLWLDVRDRILPPGKPVYLTLASSADGFGPASLTGAKIGLVFKSRDEARVEHEHDRFQQIRDNYGFLVEERQSNRDLGLFARFYDDLTDLLRVNPDHPAGVAYWSEWNPQQPLPPVQIEPAPAGVPAWAWGQTRALKQAGDFVDWWIDHRQVDGEFGGGLSDDTDLTNQWPGLALMGIRPDKLNASLEAMIEATHRNGMWKNGLGAIVTDELHVYEEGINAISQASYLSPSDPHTVERLMETAARFPDITAVNPLGRRLFVSNYFGGDHIVREDPWQWSRPYSYLILHPGIRLVDWNGAPEVRKLLLELADGYLAHGAQDAQGRWTFPVEINWPDSATRGAGGPQQTNLLMWAAYRWTGDAKYLGPIEQVLRDGGPAALAGTINGDISAELNRPEMRRLWAEAGRSPSASPQTLHAAWVATGDKTFLERSYDALRRSAQLRWSMMTDDQWWVDRVEIPTQELQRQRLGGVALWRNAIVQGNAVSWRFADETQATDLAILVRDPARNRLKIIAHNLSDRLVATTLTGAQVATGRWSLSQGADATGDDAIDAPSSARAVDFGQGASLDLTFPPGVTTVIELALDGPEVDVRDRPDLGLGARDLNWRRGALQVTVHSIGSRDAGPARLVLEDAGGRTLAETAIPALDAPTDLKPKTATLRLSPPRGADLTGARVRIVSDAAEITSNNNSAAVPPRPR